MKKLPKEEAYVNISIELEKDVYFTLLEMCIAQRKTFDQLMGEILKSHIDKTKKEKK